MNAWQAILEYFPMLFAKLLPKEGNFFELFNRHASHIMDAGTAFERLVDNYAQVDKRQELAKAVDVAERAADDVTRETSRLLHTTFITPIEREHIHDLINLMDDVADLFQDTAETLFLYDVREATPAIKELTQLSVQCCAKVQHAVSLLGKVKDPKVVADALKTCDEIDKLEDRADHVMRSAISHLFREEPDVREVLKLRAIYELLETITDKCEDVANQIEGIVLENS